MNLALPHPTELDTVTHRLDRVRRDCLRADAVARGDLNVPDSYLQRTLTRLIEDRALLTAHIPLIAERISTAPYREQPEHIGATMRPVTLAIEQANLAIARIQRALP